MLSTLTGGETHRYQGRLLHREGKVPLALGAIAWALLLAGNRRRHGRVSAVAALAATAGLAFLAQFFRHPGANTPTDPDAVVAPATGHVVHIGSEAESEILTDERLRISIFLSLFDPHLTRAPMAGRVTYQRYHPGRYLVALHPKASELNERNSVVLERADGTPFLVREIAGLVARRICSYVEPGATVRAGEEIGYIKLGSRLDVFLPLDARVVVKPGQRVRAGETVVAHVALRTG